MSMHWGGESGTRKQLLRLNPSMEATRRCGLWVLELSLLEVYSLSYYSGLPVL